MALHTPDAQSESALAALPTSVRTLIAAVTIAVASGCATTPREPARNISVDSKGKQTEVIRYYLRSERRCVEDRVYDGKLVQRQGISCNHRDIRGY